MGLPQGFYAVVCTPAPLDDGTDLLEVMRPVVRRARGAVLVSSATTGPPGMVWVARRRADGHAVDPRWFGPIRTTEQAEHLCDWLAIGGPVAPMSDPVRDLRVAVASAEGGRRRADASPHRPRRREMHFRGVDT